MVGNPNHDKSGKFSSGPGGADTGHGHNAGKGNRETAKKIIRDHKPFMVVHAPGNVEGSKYEIVHQKHGYIQSHATEKAAASAIQRGRAAKAVEFKKALGGPFPGIDPKHSANIRKRDAAAAKKYVASLKRK